MRIIPAAVLFALFLPLLVQAAPLEYPNLTEIRKDAAVFDMTTLETDGVSPARFMCDKSFTECMPFSTSTLPSYAQMLGTDNFYFSEPRDRALAQSITEAGATWKLYRTENGSATFMMDVPWTDALRNALFTTNGKIVLIGGGYVGIFDEQSGTITKRIAKSIPNNRLSASPDGRYITYYLASPASGGTRRHALYDIVANKEYLTTGKVDYWDLLSEDIKLFDWSPEGLLLYLDDKGGHPWLYVVDPAKLRGTTLAGRQLMSLPYSVADFLPWSNSEVYFEANRDNPLEWSLYRYNFVSKKLTKIANDISYGNFLRRFKTPTGDKVLFYEIRGNSKMPVLYDPITGAKKDAPLPITARVDSVSREAVKLGGVWGALWKPDNYDPAKSYPLLVWLHGGPYRGAMLGHHSYLSYGGYDEMLEAIRKQDVIILKLNYRGSYGQGRKFAESIVRNVGKGDVADVISAVNALKAKTKISDVHLAGNSYGGYLSPRAIVERPDLFRTATLINGVTDWQRLLSWIGNSIFNTQFKGPPGTANAPLYAQASIASRIAKLTPQNRLFIAYGTEDETITNTESTNFYDQLVAAGKNVQVTAYEGEGHTINEKVNLIDICSKILVMIKGSGSCAIE